MPEPTVLAPPGRQPPAGPAAGAPHREQAVVSCALLGYWTEPDADGAQSYRHRLGVHAELAYHDQDSETASVLASAHATGVLLDCLRCQRIDDHLITLIGPMPDGVIIVAVLGVDPATWWWLCPEPDGRFDLAAADEPWYPGARRQLRPRRRVTPPAAAASTHCLEVT